MLHPIMLYGPLAFHPLSHRHTPNDTLVKPNVGGDGRVDTVLFEYSGQIVMLGWSCCVGVVWQRLITPLPLKWLPHIKVVLVVSK